MGIEINQTPKIIVVVIIVMALGIVVSNLNANTSDQSASTKCLLSIRVNSGYFEKTGGMAPKMMAIDCPAGYEDLKFKQEKNAYPTIGNAVVDCWNKFAGNDNKLSKGTSAIWFELFNSPYCLVCGQIKLNNEVDVKMLKKYMENNVVPNTQATYKERLQTAWKSESINTIFIKPTKESLPLPPLKDFNEMEKLEREKVYYIVAINAKTAKTGDFLSHIVVTPSEEVVSFGCEQLYNQLTDKPTVKNLR